MVASRGLLRLSGRFAMKRFVNPIFQFGRFLCDRTIAFSRWQQSGQAHPIGVGRTLNDNCGPLDDIRDADYWANHTDGF